MTAASAVPVMAELPSCPAGASAEEIINHVDRLNRGESSRGQVTMKVKTARWSRSMTMEIASKGLDRSLIRILAPRKDAGSATLKIGDDIWNYLPKIDRTIRVPSSMMMGSWMGSHFTNDDLVKDSQMVRDYEISLAFEGDREGQDVWEFSLSPRPTAPVVWGRIDVRVRKRDCMPLAYFYYGEDGDLRRTMKFSGFQEMGGRLVPKELRIVPEDKPEEFTAIIYEALEFDVELSPGTFSLTTLTR